MTIFRADGWDRLKQMAGLVVHLAFLAAFVALTIRLWPAGIAVAGFSSISNRELGLATVSIFTALATAGLLFSICLGLVSFSQREGNAG